MKPTAWLVVACLLGGVMAAGVVAGLHVSVQAAASGTAPVCPATELLLNPGFETSTGGALDHWHKYGGTLTQADAPVHGGAYAARFDSASTSTKWVYQVVPVTGQVAYVFSAWALKNDPDVDEVYLRVSWYASDDGSGVLMGNDDSTTRLTSEDAGYRFLTTGPITAPSGAQSARARMMLNPAASVSCTAYYDDASFERAGTSEPTADLDVAKSGPDVVAVGDVVTYHVFLGNTGDIAATAVRVTDTLPTAVEFLTQTSPLTFTYSGRDLVFTLGDVASGEWTVITIAGRVGGTAALTLTNRVTATTTATETDMGNNTADCRTIIGVSGEPMVRIVALHYHGYAGVDDEAVRLMNLGAGEADLGGWTLSDDPEDADGATFPVGATLAPGASFWCAKRGMAFAGEFGFAPDYETDDTDPGLPDLSGAWPGFANDGDECALFDDGGRLIDVLVYGDSASQTGWRGVSVQPWVPSNTFARAGQILYRKLDQTSGLPVPDTNTADNWAQDPNDHVDGRKVRYPGWDLDEFFQTAQVTETTDLVVAVAPDNAYEVIKGYVDRASDFILIEGYTFENAHLIDAVVSRAQAGVTVRVLLEGGEVTDQERWLGQRLAEAGGEVYFLHNDDSADIHDRYRNQHAKFIIIDGQNLILGSENFDVSGLPVDDKTNGTWGRRGAFFITDAPGVVARAQAIFERDLDTAHRDIVAWESSHPRYGDPTPGFVPTYVYSDWVTHTVAFDQPLILTDTTLAYEVIQSPENSLRDVDGLLGLLKRAGGGDTVLVEQLYERVHWGAAGGTPASDPNPRLEAIISAARRGARVRVLLNGSWDAGSVDENGETCTYVNEIARYEGLDMQAQLGDPSGRGIHNKMVLIWLAGEGGYAHVGSINGSEASSKINRELALQVRSDEVYHYLARVFKNDWWLARPMFLPLTMRSYIPPAPPVDYVVISEVMVRPQDQSSGNREWVEIYNPTGRPVEISGYHLGDAAVPGQYGAGMYHFPEGTVLPAGGLVVIAQQGEDFQPVSGFSQPHFEFLIDPYRDDPVVPDMIPDGNWSGFGFALGDAGDVILLRDVDGMALDVLVYGTASYPGVVPYVEGLDYGWSLERRPPIYDTDDCSVDFVPRYPATPGSVPSP
jgi:uncharacterized repeat protein (TIGR01451 family)